MAIVNFAGGGKGKTANKGSCADLMAYLLHEQEERSRVGIRQIFDAQSCLFDAFSDMVPLDDAVQKIDFNRKGLKKDEAKFYYADVNFSEEELAAIFRGLDTDADKEAAIRQYIRDTFIPTYAANFIGYKDKAGNAIRFKAGDIVWAAAVHSRRLDRYGHLKEGPGWHAHVVMSRRNQGMTRSLSPTRNQRSENKGSCQGGFDRNAFRKQIELAIEEKYGYNRPVADTISTRVDMAKMSITDLETQVNALMMHGLQMQMEAEERRKAREKAAQEEAAAKKKAEELAKAEAEKAARQKTEKTRKPRLSAQEKEAMTKRPIEKAHRAWNNYYGDVRPGLAIFIEGEEGGKKVYRTFGRQAALTAQHTDVPLGEFEHSSRKMIKFISLSLEKLRGVVAEFVKHDIPYYMLNAWGLLMSDDEQRMMLQPVVKKAQIPTKKTQAEKPQSTPVAAPSDTRKRKTEGEVAFDAWQLEHKKDRPDQSRIVFVLRDGPHGKFYQTYSSDAHLAAWTRENRQAKRIEDGYPLAGLEYFSTTANSIRYIVADLQSKGHECVIIDTNGKVLDLPPEPAKQQQTAAPSPKTNSGGDDGVKVWTYQGRYYMNAVIGGHRIPVRQIAEEDWKAFKCRELPGEKLLAKYYSTEEMKPQKNISKGRGRGRG